MFLLQGVFHDTVDFELNTFCCYVLWTPEGLMAQLDEDTDGSLTTAELDEALQLYDTRNSGGKGTNGSQTAADVDENEDGDITTAEMEEWLRKNPEVMRLMCTSALIEDTALEMRCGMSYLPSDMLRHRHCQGFPRYRVEVALAPINVVLDMRDMATINTLSVSAGKGFATIFPVDDFYVEQDLADLAAAAVPPLGDPNEIAATEFDMIVGRKHLDERGLMREREHLDGSVPTG